jgi:hypothetical protein
VFAATQPDSSLLEGRLPAGEVISVFEVGERAQVLWKSDFKDELVYRVKTKQGGEGLVYYGIGAFSVPFPCDPG